MNARPGILRAALLLALLAPGCASEWALRSVEPATALQWPFAPNRAKLTYLRSLTGVAQAGGGSFRTVVYGREPGQHGAFVLPVGVATASDGRMAVADAGRTSVHLLIPAQRKYLVLTGSKTERIASPLGVVFDDGLRLFVTDSAGRLFAFAPDGSLLFTRTKAGADTLKRPTGIAYSPATKRVYVVDTLANRVYAFTRDGELALAFGARGDADGSFNFPTHVAWAAGELYVTDSLNFRIAIFDESGKFTGTFGHHGDGSGDLALPKGLAVDRDGVVYVADSLMDNVQLFDRKGTFLVTLGKRGVGDGEFWLPSGVFIGGDELFVCDTYNHRIQVFRITEHYAYDAH